MLIENDFRRQKKRIQFRQDAVDQNIYSLTEKFAGIACN